MTKHSKADNPDEFFDMLETEAVRNKLIDTIKDIPWTGETAKVFKHLLYTSDFTKQAYYNRTGKILTESEAIKQAHKEDTIDE